MDEKTKSTFKLGIMSFCIAAVVALAVTGLFGTCTSCATVKESIKSNPKEAGYATGVAIYLAYDRASKDKSDEFKATVAEAWLAINEMDLTQPNTGAAVNVAEAVLKASGKADKLDSLTPEEKAVLVTLANMLTARLDSYIGEKVGSEETTQFLTGVREGVNVMIALSGDKKE